MSVASVVTGLVVLGAPRTAHATEPPDADSQTKEENDVAFPLVVPHEKHWVRAGMEVGGVLVVGFVDYLLNTGGRGGLVRENDQKWAFRYEWQSLRGKLIGTNYDLDANKFGTNYASHPAAGTAYYEAARSNHLSFSESFLLAVLGSTTWEYFGEIRERNSVNDLIVTPVAGAAIGEPLMQLAGFFDRGRDQASNRFLSILASPIKALNDLTDGGVPVRRQHGTHGNAGAGDGDEDDQRDPVNDALGFAHEPWHRFYVYTGAGLTVQTDGTARKRYTDLAFGLETEIVNLHGYRGRSHRSVIFDDGNISSVSFTGAISEGSVVDMTFATRVVPIGYYWRNAGLDRQGRLLGQSAMFGMRLGFTYGMHDYDRDRQRSVDVVSTVSPFGVEGEYAFDAPHLRVRVGASVAGSIAGVTPYALADFSNSHAGSRGGLPTVTRNEGYYHAFGASVAPYFGLRVAKVLTLDGRMGFETFRAIEGLDEANETVDRSITLRDRRSFARVLVGWEPRFTIGPPLRISFCAERRLRSGDVGATAHASRGETSFVTSIGAVF